MPFDKPLELLPQTPPTPYHEPLQRLFSPGRPGRALLDLHEEPKACAPSSTSAATSSSSSSSSSSKPTTGLLSLPAELRLQIADHLPPDAAVSLALTCRSMKATLSAPQNNPFRALMQRTPPARCQRLAFLAAYLRDHPGWRYCFACARIHRAGVFGEAASADCGCDGGAQSIAPWLTFPFRHAIDVPQLRHVMIAHHWRRPGRPLSQLAATEFAAFQRAGRPAHAMLTVDARIVPRRLGDDNLVLFTQEWLSLRATHDGFQLSDSHPQLCQHLCLSLPVMRKQLSYALARPNEGRCRAADGRFCPHCKMAFWLETHDVAGHGRYLVVTRWMDLGLGMAPMDWDFMMNWAALPEETLRGPEVLRLTADLMGYDGDCLVDRFSQQTLQQLTKINAKKVKARKDLPLGNMRWERVDTRRDDRIWVLKPDTSLVGRLKGLLPLRRTHATVSSKTGVWERISNLVA